MIRLKLDSSFLPGEIFKLKAKPILGFALFFGSFIKKLFANKDFERILRVATLNIASILNLSDFFGFYLRRDENAIAYNS
jgi:hypothetical protein